MTRFGQVLTSLEIVRESLEVVARYEGSIGWVKDALKQNALHDITILTDGRVFANFIGVGWSDTLEVRQEWLDAPEVLEKYYSALAQKVDTDEKARLNANKVTDLAEFRAKYKNLLDNMNNVR